MDAQYPPPMPPLGAFYPSGHPPMMPPPPPEFFPARLHPLQTYTIDGIGHYSDMDDPNQSISPQHAGQRSRRRHSPGSVHVKHRRTRSGCYTCRQRRVKCDETRPVCDRCRKGKRECTYPGPTSSSSSKPARSNIKSKGATGDSPSSPSGDELDEDRDGLPIIPDDEEDAMYDESEPLSTTSTNREFPEIPSALTDKTGQASSSASTTSPVSTRPQASRSNSRQTVKPSLTQNSKWNTLPKDVKMYLRYHNEHLSQHHYGFKYDSNDFLKTTFLEIALNDQSHALLYAIVAFCAYHHTLAQEDSRISNFLTYYNKSIILLQKSLKSRKPGITTLLTILQLATIEEFLGDWVNLVGHQRAAHQILTDLFTPQTIMQDETRRKIIAWYIRFDLFAGMMSGGQTNLGREWFAACKEFYVRQAKDRPDDLGAKFEEFFSTSRVLATDVTLLIAAKARGEIGDEEFDSRAAELLSQYEVYGDTVGNAFNDPSNYVKNLPNAPPPSDSDITDYHDPNFLFGGELFTMNFVLLDYWAIELMFKYQLTTAQRHQSPEELVGIAFKKCKMIEALQYCDQGPPGVILGCQASLGIASLFLPKDQKHIDWCRRKFALIEQLGYIYPVILRKRCSEAWGVDVNNWWLPNDEGFPNVVRAIRDFIEYRARVPEDTMEAHIRDMSGIFRGLNVEEVGSTGTDSDQFSPLLDTAKTSESSPDHQWPG